MSDEKEKELKDMKENVSEKAEEIKNAAEEKKEEVKNEATEVKEKVEDKVEEKVEDTKKSVNSPKEKDSFVQVKNEVETKKKKGFPWGLLTFLVILIAAGVLSGLYYLNKEKIDSVINGKVTEFKENFTEENNANSKIAKLINEIEKIKLEDFSEAKGKLTVQSEKIKLAGKFNLVPKGDKLYTRFSTKLGAEEYGLFAKTFKNSNEVFFKTKSSKGEFLGKADLKEQAKNLSNDNAKTIEQVKKFKEKLKETKKYFAKHGKVSEAIENLVTFKTENNSISIVINSANFTEENKDKLLNALKEDKTALKDLSKLLESDKEIKYDEAFEKEITAEFKKTREQKSAASFGIEYDNNKRIKDFEMKIAELKTNTKFQMDMDFDYDNDNIEVFDKFDGAKDITEEAAAKEFNEKFLTPFLFGLLTQVAGN